jgi:hypothetical protein
MATHWTACTPEEFPRLNVEGSDSIKSSDTSGWRERSTLIADSEWKVLYKEAMTLLKTSQEMFDDSKPGAYADGKKFIRNRLVLNALKSAYPNLKGAAAPQYLPLAGERRPDAHQFITWTGTDTILGDAIINGSKLTLKVTVR